MEDTKQSYTFLLRATKLLFSKLSTLCDQTLSVEKKEVQSVVHLVGFVPMHPRASGLNMSKYIAQGTSMVRQLGESSLSLKRVMEHRMFQIIG